MTSVIRGWWLVVLMLVTAGCAADDGPYPAAPLQGTDLGGTRVDLTDMRGDVVLVTMWASWCGPCRDEVPVFDDALERWASDGLSVLGVNFRDNPDAAAQFVESEGVQFRSVLDQRGRIGVAWGVRGLPQTFVVDRSGDVVARKVGPVDAEWMASVVAEVVDP